MLGWRPRGAHKRLGAERRDDRLNKQHTGCSFVMPFCGWTAMLAWGVISIWSAAGMLTALADLERMGWDGMDWTGWFVQHSRQKKKETVWADNREEKKEKKDKTRQQRTVFKATPDQRRVLQGFSWPGDLCQYSTMYS